jgi:hypothetical protein
MADTDRFRPVYRELTPDEKEVIETIKDQAATLEQVYACVRPGRYHSLALTALEESVMWITKEITGPTEE